MQMLWDNEDRYRVDVPSEYSDRVCLAREGGFGGAACEHLDARIFDYRALDKDVRAAERAARLAEEHLGYPVPDAPWRWSETAPTAEIREIPIEIEKQILLSAAVATDPADVARGLCLDATDFDIAGILKARWPAATFTLFAAPDRPGHPKFTRYSFTIPDDIAAVDVDLVCGNNRFDLVVDAAACPDAERARTRLRKARAALTEAGRLYALFDDGTATETLDEMLAARSFSDSGFIISSIDSARATTGERLTIVCAMTQRRPRRHSLALTIVVPLHDTGDIDDAFWESLVAGVREADVEVVAARFATATDPRTPAKMIRDAIHLVTVYEPALDAAVALAYLRAPARAMCVVPAGTFFAEDWCARVVGRLRDAELGYLALDDTIAAVSIDAVDPLAWPRNFTDERLRADVLRGISLRRGFREERLMGIVSSRVPPTFAVGDVALREIARARKTGIFSETCATVDS